MASRMGRLFLFLAALALAPSLQTRAAAATDYDSDGFEASNRSKTWYFDGERSHGGYIFNGSADAHGGSYFAKLWADDGAWSSVGRVVSVTYPNPLSRYPVSCRAGFYVNALSGSYVNVEVIDPTTWTYIALQSYYLHENSGYRWLETPSWETKRQDVFVRLSIIGFATQAQARVDDMLVTCNYYL